MIQKDSINFFLGRENLLLFLVKNFSVGNRVFSTSFLRLLRLLKCLDGRQREGKAESSKKS